jgi:Protein of unknown function (DUF3667)
MLDVLMVASAADRTRTGGAVEITPPPAPPADACRNCGAHATGHFCPNCGQETRVALPTFAAFMREAAGRYVAMDGRLWRTLAALVARPGHLTREYFAGRRKRYIRPARLFLVLYLLLFAVIGILQSPLDLKDDVVIVEPDQAKAAIKEAVKAAKEERDGPNLAIIDTEDGDTLLGLDKDLNLALRWNGADITLPPQLAKRWDHFRKLPKDEKAERLYAGALRYGPYAMVALLPAFAFLMKIAYLGRGKKYPGRPQRYAEHLVYSAHLHAFAAIMILAFLLVPFTTARWALVAWVFFYAMRARQVVYRGRWWGGLIRAFFVATGYLMLMGFAIMGLIVAAIMLR